VSPVMLAVELMPPGDFLGYAGCCRYHAQRLRSRGRRPEQLNRRTEIHWQLEFAPSVTVMISLCAIAKVMWAEANQLQRIGNELRVSGLAPNDAKRVHSHAGLFNTSSPESHALPPSPLSLLIHKASPFRCVGIVCSDSTPPCGRLGAKPRAC